MIMFWASRGEPLPVANTSPVSSYAVALSCRLFPAYTLLTQLGLLAFGVAYLRAGYPAWLGGLTLGGAVVFFVVFSVVYLVFKDIPPFVYYVLTFIAGTRFMR